MRCRVLVGREAELRQLTGLLENGRRPLLFGEAGVGKTTLARAAAAASARPLLEAGALATLSWLPYLPFRRLLGRQPDGDPSYVATEVEQAVGDGLLFVDDLHWADRESREVVSLLVDRVALVAAVRRGDPSAQAAVEELAAAGFELLPLEPLAESHAAQLVERVQPGLPRATVDEIVRRSGGNPLLLEELAATGKPSESLRLSVAARLRLLGPAEREAMGLLALAGRPLPRSTLGSGAAELVAGGLARRTGAAVELRHALVGEAAVELLEPDERRALHARLARRIRAPGEAARHHAAAGERELAYRKALRAVEQAAEPGERAAHLAVAAACSSGPDAAAMLVRAAEACASAGLHHEATRLLEGLEVDRPELRGRSALLQVRAALADRDLGAATRHVADARAAAAIVGGGLEAEVAVTDARLGLERREPSETLLPRAERALRLAREHGVAVAGALHVLALVRQIPDYAGYVLTLREALAAARDEGDTALECEIADTLSRPAVAGDGVVARELVERTGRLKLAAWQRRFRCRLAGIDFHRGRFREAYEAGEELLLVALEPWERFLVAYYAAQAAADLGRHERARELLTELDRLATDAHESRRQALWARADLELLAGRPAEAVGAADALLQEFPSVNSTFAGSTFTRVARAWAALELGTDPGRPQDVETRSPFLAGARPELEGIRALADGRPGDAAERFEAAAESWRGQHVRGELRCRWAAAEALRRAGDGAAVEALLEAERLAVEHEHAPFLTRIHRSLRLAGVRRTAPRASGGSGLTSREHEVLTLVGDGLSNMEIARRLGVGGPTVERLVSSAVAKLGARSRLQAAALAAST